MCIILTTLNTTHESEVTNMITKSIKRMLQSELKAYEKIIRRFRKELDSLPEGSLTCLKTPNGDYLHYNLHGKATHLSLQNPDTLPLARDLRRKKYLEKNLKVLDHDTKILQKAAEKLIGFDPKAINDSLASAYHMIPGREPEILPGFDPGPASHYTFKSKSEELIALILEANGLVFQYEMEIIANGRHYRPDFTILHPVTHELIYWEHFGLIMKTDYYADNTQRLIDYHADGIVYGRNLVFTSETKEDPLTSNTIQAMIDHFFLQ